MANSEGTAPAELTFDDVVGLLSILDGSAFPTTIDYRNGPLELRIERGGAAVTAAPVPAAVPVAPAPTATAAPASAQEATPAPQAAPAPAAAADDAGGAEGSASAVRAPIAGVFYRAPSPGAEPFVEVGQHVDEDTVIGIVEVMKLMNTVRSGVAGTVTEVCVDDAALVEFEQPLIRVQTHDASVI
ncbi:MAG TPA: acetyl-CoA carboxylase biotin carboxyl carrier protein [Actinomycetales bacterium]|nr:acetyl-CoA carboxylase biotin carboxyl carrier protein [Actinomycetales bacterium]